MSEPDPGSPHGGARRALHRHGGAEGREPSARRAARRCCTSRSASRGRRPAPGSPRPRGGAGRGGLGYTEALGLPGLRARIARHYGERYGLDVDPRRVAVTAGASGAFILAFLAAFDAGRSRGRARARLSRLPQHPARARRRGRAAAGRPPRRASSRRADLLEALHGPLARPDPARARPTPPARCCAPAELEAPRRLLRRARHPPRRRRDLPRHHLRASPPRPCSAFGAEPIVVNSFSKYFCMTGWRLGWLVLPEAGRAGRAAGPEPLHLAPDHRPARGPGRLRRPGGAGPPASPRYRATADRLVAALRRAGLAGWRPPTAPSTSTSTPAT